MLHQAGVNAEETIRAQITERIFDGVTFQQQAEIWLYASQTRNRNPIEQATAWDHEYIDLPRQRYGNQRTGPTCCLSSWAEAREAASSCPNSAAHERRPLLKEQCGATFAFGALIILP